MNGEDDDFVPKGVRELTFRDSEARLRPEIGYPGQKVPYLGISRAPDVLSSFDIPIQGSGSAAPFRYTATRPQILLPVEVIDPGGAIVNVDVTYTPVQQAADIIGGTLNYGIASARGACYIWAPGIWYIFLFGPAGGGESLRFVVIPLEDHRLIDLLLKPTFGGRGIEGATEITLAAATVTVIASLRAVLLSEYLRITNEGANTALFAWAGDTPSAVNFSFQLAAGETIELSGLSLPLARLRAFSTLGTDIRILSQARSFAYQVV